MKMIFVFKKSVPVIDGIACGNCKKYFTGTSLKSMLKERMKEWISEDDPDLNKMGRAAFLECIIVSARFIFIFFDQVSQNQNFPPWQVSCKL